MDFDATILPLDGKQATNKLPHFVALLSESLQRFVEQQKDC